MAGSTQYLPLTYQAYQHAYEPHSQTQAKIRIGGPSIFWLHCLEQCLHLQP